MLLTFYGLCQKRHTTLETECSHMIKVEEQHDEKADGERHEDPFHWKSPKVDHPITFYCRVEGT